MFLIYSDICVHNPIHYTTVYGVVFCIKCAPVSQPHTPFDTVPHKKLLHKLNSYGINGTTHKWIGQFLTASKQQVVIDGERSRSCSVDSGVPQGTVLGPLLFLCHINDLPSCVRLFADDCILYRLIKSINDQIQLQQDLQSLEKWATTWGMRFNATKCYLMTINRSKNPLTFDYTLDYHKHNLEKVYGHHYQRRLEMEYSYQHNIQQSIINIRLHSTKSN